MTEDDLKAIQKACADLDAEIGNNKAETHVSINAKRCNAFAYFDVTGRFLGDDMHAGNGNTPLEAIADLHAKYLAQKERRIAGCVKKAALAIIEITHDRGECTDAALRGTTGESLTPEIIERAVAMANEMAEGGPFSVVKMRGANAA